MQKGLFSIFLLTFVNIIGFSILIPVLPFIVEEYNGTPFDYGILLSVYSICQFLAAPLLGAASDKFGRRPLLLLSQLGTTLSWVIFAIAYFIPHTNFLGYSLPLLIILISRITDGITGGNISIANAYIADITKPQDKTKVFGLLGAVFGFGFIIGPALGGFSNSTSIGYLGTVILSFIISVITTIVMYFRLEESLPTEKREHEIDLNILKQINIFGKLKKYSSNILVSNLFNIRIFFSLAFSAFTTSYVLYATQSLNLSSVALGNTFVYVGAFSIVNQTFVVKYFSKIFGDEKTFYIGMALFAISLLAFGTRPNLIFFIIILFIQNLGVSLSGPTFSSIISNAVTEKQQGEITGIDSSIMAASRAVAPFIGAVMYQYFGYLSFPLYMPILLIPFVWNWIKEKSL